MFRFWVCCLILICVVQSSKSFGSQAFRNDFISTESFFQKLSNDYESVFPNKDVKKELDDKISEFLETLQSPIRWRHRRHLDEHKSEVDSGIRVLKGFSTILEDPFPNVLAISIFTYLNGIQTQWFAATLDAFRIILYLYDGNRLEENNSYPMSNGSALIVNCSELGCLLVISKIDGGVTVLRLEHETSGYVLRPVQYVGGSGDVYLSIWNGMNQMYLGIGSNKNISIYRWLGEHFDSIQVLDYDTEKLTLFQIGGSLYLAVTGVRAAILKFFLHSNSFVLTQRLLSAVDVESFYVEKEHQKEHYLILSNDKSTIIFKFFNDHFIPFQEIARADRISSFTTRQTIVLLALTGNMLRVYQYDGWKFVQLSATMPEVDSFYPTTLNGEIILLVRHTDGRWRFNKLIWEQQSTWEILREGIKNWALDTVEKTKRSPAVVPKLNEPVRILRGHIEKLQTKNINERNPKQIINFSNRFKELKSNFTSIKEQFSKLMRRNNPRFATLYVSNVSGNCTLGCNINNLNTTVKYPLLENLVRSNEKNQNLEFERVKVSSTGNFPCPKPAVEFKNVTIGGLINGIEFEMFQENLLKVTGEQEVTGEYVFYKLLVSSAMIPLEIAAQSTQQDLHMRSVKANNLYLTQGGILVPQSGRPILINGTTTAAKVKVTGTVHLRGKIDGKGVKTLAPVTEIQNPLILRGNYSLERVAVQDQASSLDINFAGIRSLTQIINEAVHLDEDVPVHLTLLKSKTIWSNITANMTDDWIKIPNDASTLDNVQTITGTKRCPNNLTISNLSYRTLPVPKINRSLCASEATLTDVETTVVKVNRASARFLKTEHMFGATELNATIADTATSTDSLNISSKVFTGNFNVKDAVLDSIDGIDFRKLLVAMVGWREPGLVEGLVNASNLAIKNFVALNGFVLPRITSAKNLFSEGNIYFDKLNGIDISELAKNVVKLDETMSFANVTFVGILKVDTVETLSASIDFSWTGNLGKKIITQNLKSASLKLPYSFTYPSAGTPASFTIEGSATFTKGPRVESINEYNFDRLSEEIWFADKPSVLSNRVLIFRDMVLEGPVQVLGNLNSQSYGPWDQLSKRLFSRTRPQEINVRVYLKKAIIPNIITEGVLELSAPETFLNGLDDRTLKKNGSQSLTTAIHFHKLIILGDLNTHSRINGKNLATNIVRFDAADNVVTGKKTVLSLWADNVDGGLNFGEWQKNTLKISNEGEPVYVSGSKIFANLALPNGVKVEGLVNDNRMENYFLKSLPQQISGSKMIHGIVYASKLYVDGFVNDINVTSLLEHQLKKNKPVQKIKTKILTTGNVYVTGNIEANGLYHGVELKSLKKFDSDLDSVGERMSDLKDTAKKIHTALSRRAWYWDKLELIEVKSLQRLRMSSPKNSKSVTFEGLGSCTSKDRTLICDNEAVPVLIFAPNSSRILFNQVFEVVGIPLIVFATSDPNGGVWIYTYDNTRKQFHQIAGLNLPGAMQASAIVTGGSLWLAVQLTFDTIILRYEAWGQFEEYTLPGTELFLMELSPLGELLIFRSDGVWRLGGLSGPRQLARVGLNGEIGTFVIDDEYYVEVKRNNYNILLKTRYTGN